ncbi:hypothetical protein Cgig2_006258 [Carnegiea gigantea]|uniref:Uncharacterized protein n=1 Tax=Carnegiea gigantea TaxID=171969 RepID=A0A9Q1JPT7_9CARY|nr:hypothetical protein Cgig2_006258 [Carnegiea gigantea]
MLDAFYVSLFLYDLCSNLIQAVYEHWCLEINTPYTSKAEGHTGKLTIEQWIPFWFRGPRKYHVSKKLISSKRQENTSILGDTLASTHLSSIGSRRLLQMITSYQELTLLIFLSLTIVKTTLSWMVPKEKKVISGVNILKDECVLGSKPKLKIVQFGKPLKFCVPLIEDDSYHTLSSQQYLHPRIPIQSTAPSTKVTNEIKEHFEPSPTKICRQKFKFIINCSIDGYDKLPIGVCKPSSKRYLSFPTVYLIFILLLCFVLFCFFKINGESDNVNFKEELAHIPPPLQSHYFPSIEQIQPFIICPLNDDEVKFTSRANISVLIRILSECSIRPYLTSIPFDGLPSLKGDFKSNYAINF